MSELLRIKPVSALSKIKVLREFGHRVFAELGNDGAAVGYFVETKETAGIAVSKQQPGRRHAVTGNVALVWAGVEYKSRYRESLTGKIAEALKEFAATPTRREELVEAIAKETGYTELQVTNAISYLTGKGHLVVPG